MTESVEILILLSLEDGDSTELDELTQQLKFEIEQLHVDLVESVSDGAAPTGTKGTDWASIGNMVVTLAPVIIPPLFDVIKSWIGRRPSIPVKIRVKVGKKTAQIEYDPTKTSAEELEELVKLLGRNIRR